MDAQLAINRNYSEDPSQDAARFRDGKINSMPMPSLINTQEYLLSLRDLLEEKTGLYTPEEKLAQLEESCKDPKLSLSSNSLEQIILSIVAGTTEGRNFLNELIAAITTNETYFFRNTPHFEVLKNTLIPELSQLKNSQGKKTLRLWSAGCSTGEEPYSLAIFLLETLPDIRSWDIHILATDIDLDALEIAQTGIYRNWSFRGVKKEIIKKYFHREGENCYRVDDRVRTWITFEPLNLKNYLYPSPFFGTTDLDIILCRNVTIYFRPETTQEVVHRFYACLNEGGFLLSGSAEYLPETYGDFEARAFPGTIIYQKPSSRKEIPRPTPVLSLMPISTFGRSSIPEKIISQVKVPQVNIQQVRIPQANIRPIKIKPTVVPQKDEKISPTDVALELVSRGEVDKATVLLAGQDEKGPQDSRGSFLLGKISADRCHLHEAIYWLSRTLELDPIHLWAHFLLGLLWMEESKLEKAIQSLKKVLYLEPTFPLVHFHLGRIYKEQGEFRLARKSFAVAKSLLDSIPSLEALRGEEEMTTGQLLALVDRELNYE